MSLGSTVEVEIEMLTQAGRQKGNKELFQWGLLGVVGAIMNCPWIKLYEYRTDCQLIKQYVPYQTTEVNWPCVWPSLTELGWGSEVLCKIEKKIST